MTIAIHTFAILAAVMLRITPAVAEGENVKEKIKAALIFQFLRNIDWSDSAFSLGDGAIVVTVVADSRLADLLAVYAKTKKVAGRDIQLQTVKEEGVIPPSQVVVIGTKEGSKLSEILSRVPAGPVLTIGEGEGFLKRGVIINFFEQSNRLRFEVSQESAERRKLVLGSQILRFAGGTE